MDKQRTLFFGFIIGFAFIIMPIPPFFFWEEIVQSVETLFRYAGIILMTVCGIPLILDVINAYRR